MIRKYADIFCWKNVSSFCSAKATHIFSAKNIRILYIESAKTVNEMTLNELVKLTMLWTTGPCMTTILIYPSLDSLEAIEGNVTSEDTDQTAEAQADLNLCWLRKSYCRFCLALAHIVIVQNFHTPTFLTKWHINIADPEGLHCLPFY